MYLNNAEKSIINLRALQLVVSEQKLGPSVPRYRFAMLCCGSLKIYGKILRSDRRVTKWMEFHLLALSRRMRLMW